MSGKMYKEKNVEKSYVKRNVCRSNIAEKNHVKRKVYTKQITYVFKIFNNKKLDQQKFFIIVLIVQIRSKQLKGIDIK